MSNYPHFFRVRQKFVAPEVADPVAAVHSELKKLALADRVRPGQTVAITAGSRGIAHIKEIIRATVDHFKSLGAEPFIVPAMGSHGGGTVEGQLHILTGYGITEEYCGCRIKASMETVIVCQTDEGFPVHFDRFASEADHVMVVGRVKPHTDFVGEIESGLMKMMLIGLGKHEGAKIYHRAIQNYSFGQILRSVASQVLANCRIIGGLAILENAYDETALIEAVRPENFQSREKELLILAREWLPRLPFRIADILIIDEIGKNISGAGLDTNVVGRKFHLHAPAVDEYPKVKRIIVRGLSEATAGNASGIGMAEFCTTRTLRQMNSEYTRINCLTSSHVGAAMIPIDFETDRELLDATLPTIGLTEPPDAKILWIHNTLDVAEVECSEVFLTEARSRDDLEIISDIRELTFDEAGNLPASLHALGSVPAKAH